MHDRAGVLPDFSLVLGGPLYQLFLRTRMARAPLDLLYRRMVGIPLVVWLPLLFLSIVEGHAVGGGVAVPFLHDVEAHVRYLVALPLLILAELVVHLRRPHPRVPIRRRAREPGARIDRTLEPELGILRGRGCRARSIRPEGNEQERGGDDGLH